MKLGHTPRGRKDAARTGLCRFLDLSGETRPVPTGAGASNRSPVMPAAFRDSLEAAKAEELAGGPGFEPRLTESESAVLPLNYPPPKLLKTFAIFGEVLDPGEGFQSRIGDGVEIGCFSGRVNRAAGGPEAVV